MKNKRQLDELQAIEMHRVVKHYGDNTVLRGIDLKVSDGECLLLVGHNGAGKTTLMKLMLGLTRPSEGTVRVLGVDPASAASVASRVRLGFLPESVTFQQAMSGREVLSFYARLNGSSIAQCDELLERVGLSEAAHRRVHTYSKGMRQRLGLAQALLGDPQLLLLDEPTTGLDPSLRQHFYRIIDDMRSRGVTSVICSHALNAFEARVDRVAIIKQGNLVACGSLAELSERTALPVKIRVAVTQGQAGQMAERLGGDSGICQLNGQSVDIECLSSEKVTMIRRITELGDVIRDVDVTPPRLDEIYNYYMQEGSEARFP